MYEALVVDQASTRSKSIFEVLMKAKLTILISLVAFSMIACDSKKEATPDTKPAAQAADGADKKADDAKAKDGADKKGGEAADTKKAPESQPATTDGKSAGILGIGKTPEDIAAGATNMYGANFTIIEEPITLATAIEKSSAGNIGPYKVSAKMKEVCPKKGCWFMLDADDVKLPIRVTMKDYAFFVPKNAAGADVILEGTFEKTTIDQKTAQHYADDKAEATGKPAPKVDGPQDSWVFTASAVQVTKS